MVRRFWGHLVIVILLTLLWALFFWRLLTPNPIDRVVFPEGDFTQHYYAFSFYQVDRLADGDFPLWNPYNHSGDPFAANIQFVAFYPPRLIAAAIAGDNWSLEAYQLEVAAHYWLASLMMYGFLVTVFQRKTVALIGSVIYAYSGYLTGYPMLQVSVLESVVWLPLIMLGVHLSITRAGIRWVVWGGAIAGVGVALSFLGGHPQTTMQLIYLALAYLAFMTYHTGQSITAFVIRAGVFGAIGAGLSMIQLLPAAEFTRLSYRVTQLGFEDKANGFLAGQLMQVVWPELFGVWSPLYIGVAGLLLALGTLLRLNRPYLFWWGVVGLGLFLSMGGNSIVFDFFYNVIPGFSIFRQQERIASVMIFALVVLATSQLDWFYTTDTSHTHYRLFVYGYVGFLLVAYMGVTVVTLLQNAAESTVTDVFGFTAIVGIGYAAWVYFMASESRKRLSVHLLPLLLLIVIDLFTIGTRSENYLPDGPENRVELLPELEGLQVEPTGLRWRVDGAASLQGNGVLFYVPDIYGTGPFSLSSIEELRQIPVDRFWEVLAVRYVTTLEEPPTTVDLELLAYDANYSGDEYRLFEIQDPRPLAHLVYDYHDAQGNPEFARQIMSDSRVDLREMAITLDPLPFGLPDGRPEISEIVDFQFVTPEHIKMTVSTGTNGLLTLAMVNYPGWRAYVNDERVEIVDTYAGLIGVPIRSGEGQQVRLEFVPDSVRQGVIVTVFTVIVVMGASIWVVIRRGEDHGS